MKTMPTVHLSIPDKVYMQLKQKAAEVGIQVTDLIKLYAIQGMKYGLEVGGGNFEALMEASKRIDMLQKDIMKKLSNLEGKYYELLEQVNYLYKRVNLLQELVESRGPVLSENIEKTV